MSLLKINKIFILLLSLSMQITYFSFAEEPDSSKNKTGTSDTALPELFQGKVNSDNINIRSDSTTSSEVICKINKNEYLDVTSELYEWYKIRLPRSAPTFIKKDFLSIPIDKTAKVLKNNVNIRFRADTTSLILGTLNQDELVKILEDTGDWYKIEPVHNSFGWIHKNFVDKVAWELKVVKNIQEKKETINDNTLTFEGIIKPNAVKRIATHKLISTDNKVFLLKGDKKELKSFNHRRVKIICKLIDPLTQENPIIEVEKIEALD